jgi:hypothetical protein
VAIDVHLRYQNRAFTLGTVHDLFVKVVEQLTNFTLSFVLRQIVRHIAEAIEIGYWFAKHLEVRVFADKIM